MTDLKQLKMWWTNILAFYSEPLNEIKVDWLAKDCLKYNLSTQELDAALELYRREDKLNRAPTLAHILEYTKPKQPSIEELAKKDADDIPMLVRQCGWTDGQAAKEQMSHHAWNFVMAQGGWQHICENLGTEYMPIGVFVSQAYESCKASRLREKTKLHNIEIEARKHLIQNPKADIQAFIETKKQENVIL